MQQGWVCTVLNIGCALRKYRPALGWLAHLGPLAVPPTATRWWSFEALILMSGWLPDATLAVATMGVCNLTNSVS